MMDLSGARILVSGGTGSFGNALIDHLHDSGAEFIVYSRDEAKQHEMYITRQDRRISYVIGDIRDKGKLIQAMQGVDYVFHAAALKHVPTGERWPEEVIQTNILGTGNVLEATEHCGVKKVVVLSTDKAAYPVSAYGMSKALAEKLVAAHEGNAVIVSLRYGNVLGSRGSVVPLFLSKIKQGNPLTVTDYNMTRFVLTLREAVNLAMKCLYNGENNELFVMKPPACSIRTLVDSLKLEFGDFREQTIGIRPGEKLHEVLLTGDELYRSTEEEDKGVTYARIQMRVYPDYHFTGEEHVEPDAYTSETAPQLTPEQLLEKMKKAGLL